MTASASEIFTDQASDVVFRVTLKANPNILSDGVKLYQTDGAGNISALLGTLKDDGIGETGDDVPNDSVYGLKVSLSESQDNTLHFKVIASSNTDQATSNVIAIKVLKPLTDDQINQVDTISNDTTEQYENAVNTLPPDQVNDATVAWLQQQDGVIAAGYTDSMIWYQLDSGINGGIMTGDSNNSDGGDGKQKDYATRGSEGTNLPKLQEAFANDSTTNDSAIKALLLSPTFTQFSNRTPATIFEDSLDNLSTNLKIDFTKDYNSAAGVEAFKTLDNYNVVVIHTHGGDYKGQVINLTGTEATPENLKTYDADLRANPHRLVVVSAEGINWLAVTPAFIEHYNNNFPNTIVYGGFCDSHLNNTMSNEYLSHGAKTYYGFSNSVLSNYNDHIGSEVFRSLITDNSTTEDAFDNATDLHGKTDGNVATFEIDGDKEAKLASSSLTNGSFETGTISGWNGSGDVRVIQKLANLKPTNGNYMTILSTGLGSVSESTSNISQTITIPQNASKLSFDIDFVSEEPMEYVGSQYDDRLLGYIHDANQDSEETLVQESVNQATWYPVSGIDFEGGDQTTYETKFKHIEYDVTNLRGHIVTIGFKVWDEGDSIYDSAALIDNIKLS